MNVRKCLACGSGEKCYEERERRKAQQQPGADALAALDELEQQLKKSHEFAERQCIERVAQDARDYYNIRASTLEFVLDKLAALRRGGERE
jgi:hypothetical protein